nr:hypothetical protein Iba_chr06cCG15610 [Ipomoea batatas]
MLGEDAGTVPLGSAFLNSLSSAMDGIFLVSSCKSAESIFLLSMEETKDENTRKTAIKKTYDEERAILFDLERQYSVCLELGTGVRKTFELWIGCSFVWRVLAFVFLSSGLAFCVLDFCGLSLEFSWNIVRIERRRDAEDEEDEMGECGQTKKGKVNLLFGNLVEFSCYSLEK